MSSLPSDPRTMTPHHPYPRHGFDLGREATALASLHLIELSRDGESWCGRMMTQYRPLPDYLQSSLTLDRRPAQQIPRNKSVLTSSRAKLT